MPIRRDRDPKPSSASPVSERAEIETMLRRLEELRRASHSNDLRGAYQVAINGLDGVAYRLTMLRAPVAPKPVRRSAPAPVTATPPSAPEPATPASAVATRIGAARKPRR
jgi:hypothetical protein